MRRFYLFLKTSLQNKAIYYEQFDRVAGFLSFLLTVLGICIAVFVENKDIIIISSFIILYLVIACITWLALRIAHRYGQVSERLNIKNIEILDLNSHIERLVSLCESKTKNFEETSNYLHNIFHKMRTLHFNMLGFLEAPDSFNKEELNKNFDRFIDHLLENIRALFNKITGHQCAVTIKAIDPENDKIYTYQRDGISDRERGKVDETLPSYDTSDNAAFHRILSRDFPHSLYVNDNLISAFEKGEYFNRNPEWQRYYSACLVVPIRVFYKKTIGEEQFLIFGFLCVDNKGGGFENKLAENILSALGDSLYCLFYSYGLLKSLLNR